MVCEMSRFRWTRGEERGEGENWKKIGRRYRLKKEVFLAILNSLFAKDTKNQGDNLPFFVS